jgi:competence protein ComFB
MEIYNYMEDIVRDSLDSLLAERQDICKCEKCRLDMSAWALNRLPPKYVVSNKGRVFTKLQEVQVQFKADVIRELLAAIANVSKNPQH